MKDLNDYHRTQRFKTTLANFHSYCQRQSQESSIIINNRSKSSCNIGNYKNIRQLRKKGGNKSQIFQNQSKKKTQCSNSGQIFNIKNTDLIEIIKLKLKNDKFASNVEEYDYKTYKKKSFNQRHYGYYQFCNLTSKYSNTLKGKKKRIDLIISNSICKPSQHPKSRRQQSRISELIVTLQDRPYSAIQKSTINHVITNQNTSKNKLNTREKAKRYDRMPKRQKSDSKKNNQSGQKVKQISGWELTQNQDDPFYIQDPSRKRMKK